VKIIKSRCGKDILIDDEYYDEFSKIRWFINSNGYAVRNIDTKQKYMHRIIMGEPQVLIVDHKNRNKLDNRKSNLRLATRQQNQANRNKTRKPSTSKYIGVCFNKVNKKWNAFIHSKYMHKSLGTFRCETRAAIAYDNAAKIYHGEFANLNFPPK
jgi:hypothetical protein